MSDLSLLHFTAFFLRLLKLETIEYHGLLVEVSAEWSRHAGLPRDVGSKANKLHCFWDALSTAQVIHLPVFLSGVKLLIAI